MFSQRRLAAFRKGVIHYTTCQIKQAKVRACMHASMHACMANYLWVCGCAGAVCPVEGPACQPHRRAAVVSCRVVCGRDLICLARKQAVMDELCGALAAELTLDQTTQAAIRTYSAVLVRAGVW